MHRINPPVVTGETAHERIHGRERECKNMIQAQCIARLFPSYKLSNKVVLSPGIEPVEMRVYRLSSPQSTLFTH